MMLVNKFKLRKVDYFWIKSLLRLTGLFYTKESLYYIDMNDIRVGARFTDDCGFQKSPFTGDIGFPKIWTPDQWTLHYEYKIDINPYLDIIAYCDSIGWRVEYKSYQHNYKTYTDFVIIEDTIGIRNRKLETIIE